MTLLTTLEAYEDDKGNVIEVGENIKSSDIHIRFSSSNCRIIIGSDVTIQSARFTFGAPGGTVSLGRHNLLCNVGFMIGLDSTVTIGDDFSITNGGKFSAAERTTLSIARDCMMATNIEIRTDHAHPIFDRVTGSRLNISRDISIGEHVWLGPDVIVFPGARIGEGAVIGARSIVTKDVEPNCIAVGVPAKVVRRNIVWSRAHFALWEPFLFETSNGLDMWNSTVPVAFEPHKSAAHLASRIRRWLGKALQKAKMTFR